MPETWDSYPGKNIKVGGWIPESTLIIRILRIMLLHPLAGIVRVRAIPIHWIRMVMERMLQGQSVQKGMIQSEL